MILPRALCALALLGIAAPAIAAKQEETPPREKVASLIVYGNDPCPRSSEDEIIVCAREPESERYRVPKRFRGKKIEAPQEAWANRVSTLEAVSRAGTPNSCSPVGSGGFTGCQQQFLTQMRAERKQAKQDAADIP